MNEFDKLCEELKTLLLKDVGGLADYAGYMEGIASIYVNGEHSSPDFAVNYLKLKIAEIKSNEN